MSSSINIGITDLVIYGVLSVGGVLVIMDMALSDDLSFSRAAVFAAIIVHHAWSRITERQRIKAIVAALVISGVVAAPRDHPFPVCGK